MIIINSVDSQRFSLNGIEYFKNFTPVVAGDSVRIINTYTSYIELVHPTDYSGFTVDGNTFTNVSDLQSALLPVIYTRDTLGGGGGQGESTSGTGNNVTFENPLGKFYNLDSPNGEDIVIDATGAVNGGVAVIYSIGISVPNITGGDIVFESGTYNPDGETLNVIFITKDTNNKYLVNIQPNSFTGYTPNLNPETQALIDQSNLDGYTSASNYKLLKLNNFIQGLKDNNIWDSLDRLYITETNGDSNFSRYDVKNPTISANVLGLIGLPTFNNLSGWHGQTINGLNTNFKPATNGVNYQQDSSSIVIYQTSFTTGYMSGVIDSVDGTNRIQLGGSNVALFNTLNGSPSSFTHSVSNGVYHLNRENSSSIDTFKDGVLLYNIAQTSKAPTNDDVYLLSRNIANAVNAGTDATIGICMIGGNLKGKEVVINQLIQTYIG